MDKKQKEARVYAVFEKISKRYDSGNNRISLGLQKKWKEDFAGRIAASCPVNGSLLDVCCGTGDISILVAKKRSDVRITGIDFSPAMLEEAERKSKGLTGINWQKGDALSLPFSDNRFSAACISFGLRNTSHYETVLSEMRRVVQDDGMVYCLDSFVPEINWVRPFHRVYFKYIIPFLGGGTEYYKEYLWLYESTQQFLSKKELLGLYHKLKFQEVTVRTKLCGTCVSVQGKK